MKGVMRSLKATSGTREGQLVFNDSEYEAYSYKDSDCVYGFSWRDFNVLPEQLKALTEKVSARDFLD